MKAWLIRLFYRQPAWCRSGWTLVVLLCLGVFAMWIGDLGLALGNSDDGRILARFGLGARNFWDMGVFESRFGAVMAPYAQADGQHVVQLRVEPALASVTYAHHPPLQLFFSIVSVGAFGDSVSALRVMGFVLGSATVGFIAALLRFRQIAWGPTLLAVAAMSSTGFFYVYARIGVGYSLLVAVLAAVAWLTRDCVSPRWVWVGLAGLTALAAMQSWIAMVSMGLVAVWLLLQAVPRSDVEVSSTRGVVKWIRSRWNPAATAVSVGTLVGMVVTAVWILNATDISEMVERVGFRTGSAVETSTQSTQFSFREFLSRQWSFAKEELLAPLWLRILLVPALVAGLVDKRTRFAVVISLSVAAILTFGFQQGAWIHRLWNFPWLAPATIGMAALFDHVRTVLSTRLRVVVSAGAAIAVLMTAFLVVTGSTRERYLTEPADAGELVAGLVDSDEVAQAELVWATRHVPTPRWIAYYLDLPVHTLNEEDLGDVIATDIVVLDGGNVPDWFPSGWEKHLLGAQGKYVAITGQGLLATRTLSR